MASNCVCVTIKGLEFIGHAAFVSVYTWNHVVILRSYTY